MLQVQLHGPVSQDGTRSQALTPIVSDLEFGTAIPGGFSNCSFSLALSEREAFEWYSTKMGHRIHVHQAKSSLWEGRVESVAIRPYGADVTCVGYWSALTDHILHQWWAEDRPSEWKPATLAGNISPINHPLQTFASGSYVGTGTGATLSIDGLAFDPKVVIVKGDIVGQNGVSVIRIAGMTTSKVTISTVSHDGILSLDSFGFTVKDNSPTETVGLTNELGVTYYWWALGGSDTITGTYVGTETSNPITGVGGTPVLVMCLRADPSSNNVYFRTTQMTTTSMGFNTPAPGTQEITSLDVDGFTLGTASTANKSGETYWWFALLSAENLAEGTYTGDGNDDRDLPAAAMEFNPAMVMTKGAIFGVPLVWKDENMAGDASFHVGSNELTPDMIQSITEIEGKFQIGTSSLVNFDTAPYFWFALRALPDAGIVPFYSNYKFMTSNEGGIIVSLNNDTYVENDAAAYVYGLPFIINSTQDEFWQQPNYIKQIYDLGVTFFNSTWDDSSATEMYVEVWRTDDFQAGTWTRVAKITEDGNYQYSFVGSEVRAIMLRVGGGNIATQAYSQPVGDARVEIYPIAVKATTEDLTAHEIVRQNIVGNVDLIPQNDVLKRSSVFITTEGDTPLIIRNRKFEGVTLQEIINNLAQIAADTATETWYPAVWDGRFLHFSPIDFSAPPKWHISRNLISDDGLELERSLATYWSHVRSFFKDARGLIQTIAVKTDPVFGTAIPVTRKYTLDAGTVPQPEAMRDAFYDDSKVPQPHAEITVSGLVIGPGGAPEPIFMIRSGDIIQIDDMLPARNVSSASRDPLRTFIVRETSYSVNSNTMTLSLEWPTDRLDTLIANITSIRA